MKNRKRTKESLAKFQKAFWRHIKVCTLAGGLILPMSVLGETAFPNVESVLQTPSSRRILSRSSLVNSVPI